MLILASQSPRRRQILTAAGITYTARVSEVPEVRGEGEGPREYVMRLARQKAEAVRQDESETVLGADTTVVVDQHVLEKPENAEDAMRMLRLMSGRMHDVMTGICILHGEQVVQDVAVTQVHFAAMSEDEMAWYVRSGEPMDKAGAYGIQGLVSRFVDRVEGDYLNIVGLPVALVYKRLRALGALGGDE